MRVLRRRVAAMSPREKHLALLSALGIVSLALYYIPTFFYATLILAVGCIVCYYHSGETLPARLGLNQRPGLKVPGVLRRWLLSWGLTGVSANTRVKTKSSNNRNEVRGSERHFRQRPTETGIYRREALASDSFLFSPRDILMGSYIGKNESPVTDYGRPRAARNPREQLREKLSRPNHAVLTPNRRLSFAGEPLGTVGRFTITPQRHYPLQQPGVSSVGVLPPAKWDGFRKKNILSPRNSPGALSPVTVKIARPDHSTPSLDHLSCSRQPRAPADPCSRESVLRVLKESRKREVEEEDRSFTTEQKSKRRRNDSGGSAHSAFESLLPNGTPSQLVPKPGSLKRGMISLAEESVMKRSRTSSISSATGVHTPRGTPGTRRNPIHSSYSSSLGFSQWKKPSAPSPPLSSPGSSRSQTPEGLAKKPREDDGQSPSSASSVRSDQTASDKAPVISKLTPVPKVPIATSADSTGSGGKRKRKIQLLSSHRDDQITLPPPPELGYAVTVKDLDEEKKAAISKIQKVLETPALEPEKTPSLPATTSTLPVSSTISTSATFSSLLAAPLLTDSSSAIPVINLDPSPGSSKSIAPPASNPLLEALKMKTSTSATASSAASTLTVSASTIAVQPSGSNLKTSTTSDAPQLPPASQPQSSTASMDQPSAFTQVLGQVSKASSSTQPVGGAGLFGLASQISTPSSSATSNTLTATTAPASSSEAFSNTNPLLASGFKPIFAVTTASTTSTSEIKPPVQNFKPIFGGTTAGANFGQPPSLTTTNPTPTVSSSSTSIFGGLTSSTTAAQSVFPGLTSTSTSVASSGAASTGSITTTKPAAQPAVKSLFGNWPTSSTTITSSASAQASNTGSTFQFGTVTATTAAAPVPAPAPAPASVTSTTTSSNSALTFGFTQPGPQEAGPKVFPFGQSASSQNTTTASFGGFGLTNTASTTPATTTQSTFLFGKQSFEAPAAQSTFGSSAAPPKPFTFGSGASSTPASNPTPAPFNFVSGAATTAATFGTPAKPAFGASTTGFPFGGTTAPSAAPNFGAATQTQSSSTFNFGSTASQPAPSVPAQPATGGFNFGAGLPCPQFGTPVSNNPAPQMGSFNFGAAATDKPAFGTSTPSFGQSAPAGPIPFGSPGTPVQGFNAVPFGSPATPSFSIGAGSKPSGARQRLQARRQHNRKK